MSMLPPTDKFGRHTKNAGGARNPPRTTPSTTEFGCHTCKSFCQVPHERLVELLPLSSSRLMGTEWICNGTKKSSPDRISFISLPGLLKLDSGPNVNSCFE